MAPSMNMHKNMHPTLSAHLHTRVSRDIEAEQPAETRVRACAARRCKGGDPPPRPTLTIWHGTNLEHELRSLNNDCNLSRPNGDHTCVRVLCTVPLAPIPLFPEHLIELGALARVCARAV